MRLTHLTINNMRGLAHFDGDIPAVALISGKNGEGKSSILSALMYAAGRRVGATGARGVEHDPTMLHGDAERGECILTFDDPEGNLQYLKCVITKGTDTDAGSTTRYTKAADSKKYVKAGSNLDGFFNALGYDPFKIKDMAPKERIDNILRILPSTVTVEEITTAVGGVVPCAPHPSIETVQALYDDIFKMRTDVNRDVDTLSKQAELLDAAPGVGDGEDWVAQLQAYREEKDLLEAKESAKANEIRRALESEKSAAAEARRLEDIKIDQEVDAKIAAWNADRAKRKAGTALAMQNRVEAARATLNNDAQAFADELKPAYEAVIAGLATAETRATVQIEAEGTRKAAVHTKKQAAERKEEALRLTGALDRLKDLKGLVSTRLDLDGAIIASPRRGQPVDLCREEAEALVPFSAWNTADKQLMCLRIALKSQGKCGLVIIDSIGDFDEEAKQGLKEACQHYAGAGISFIVGSATSGPLSVAPWE